jgi:Fe-S cluster biogenesis protein NfuA
MGRPTVPADLTADVPGTATAAVEALLATGGGGLPPTDDGSGPARPLSDPEVERLLAALDELLGQVEQIPGPAGELAVEAVAALAEVYGAALTRAMAYVGGATDGAGTPLAAAFTGDALLGHLLALHGIHPDPVDVRIARALDDVRGALGSHAGAVELVGVDAGVAEVHIAATGGGCSSGGGSGCGCSSGGDGLEDAVRDAVLGAAPELTDVRIAVPAEAPRPAAFVPLDSLLRAPAQRVP